MLNTNHHWQSPQVLLWQWRMAGWEWALVVEYHCHSVGIVFFSLQVQIWISVEGILVTPLTFVLTLYHQGSKRSHIRPRRSLVGLCNHKDFLGHLGAEVGAWPSQRDGISWACCYDRELDDGYARSWWGQFSLPVLFEKCSRVHSHCPSPQYVSISESSDSENLLIVSKVFFDNG